MLLYILLSTIIFLVVANKVAIDNVAAHLHCVSCKGVTYAFVNLLSVSFFAVLFFLTAFRAKEIGNDTITYIEYFERYANYANFEPCAIEPGFRYIYRMLVNFTDNPYVFLIIIAITCYVLIAMFIFNNSKNYALSVCMFFALFFSSYTNILRQGLAMAITTFAYLSINKNRNVLGIAIIVLACTIHKSALICCLWLFYKVIPKDIKKVFCICLITISLAVSGKILEHTMVNYVGNYIHYGSYYMFSKYRGSGYLAVGVHLAFAIIFYITIYRNYKCNSRTYMLSLTNAFLFLMLNSLGFFINLFTRLAYYYLLILCVDVPNMVMREKRCGILEIIYAGMVLSWFLVGLYFRPEWNHLYPYRTWL